MPELPEVETIARELDAQVRGRRIAGVRVLRADALGEVTPAAFAASLRGRTLLGTSRRGKFLVLPLAPEGYLVAHLRMTGKFALSAPLARPAPHHRVWFTLDDGRLLIFQDMRCFGTLEVVGRLEDSRSLSRLGAEPLARGFTAARLAAALAAARTPLKPWLMDQSRIAGLGNIYAAEICFAAGIDPARPGRSLGEAEVRRLHRAMRRILRRAIAKNGTTISDFRRVDEKTGEFQNFLQVYGKAGGPCPRCRTPIGMIRQQQRSTFFCPGCQR